MTSDRKPSFDSTLLNDENLFGCAAAAAAGALAALNNPKVCEESIQAAVIAATTVSPNNPSSSISNAPSTSNRKLSDPEPTYFVSKDSDGTSLMIPMSFDEAASGGSAIQDENNNVGLLTEEKLREKEEEEDNRNNLEVEALCNGVIAGNQRHPPRDRFESWGGLSDLSITGVGSLLEDDVTAAAALAASALQQTGIIDDITAAAASIDIPSPLVGPTFSASPMVSVASESTDFDNHSLSQIMLPPARLDPNNLAYSISKPNLSQIHASSYPTSKPRFTTSHHSTGFQMNQTKAVHQANAKANVGLKFDLESLVAKAFTAVNFYPLDATQNSSYANIKTSNKKRKLESITTKQDSVCDIATLAALKVQEAMHGKQSKQIYSHHQQTYAMPPRIHHNGTNDFSASSPFNSKFKSAIPLNTSSNPYIAMTNGNSNLSTPVKSNPHAYLHNDQTPVFSNKTKSMMPSPNMRTPVGVSLAMNTKYKGKTTPSMKSSTKKKINYGSSFTPVTKTKGGVSKMKGDSVLVSPSTGQSNQKWEDMFHCLVEYVERICDEDTKGSSPEAKRAWEWCGNVPTTYKTPDGKALGRWINNQRSAKNKGTLKTDREVRLVSTGLKWSVLSTNAWPDMMNELRIYVRNKTKNGQKWDGNVPTNYRIKSNTASDGTEIDEEKNLGRWINRQRSLFQGGRLKKDRQMELEKIGLKWSVLSTTSWETMYDALCTYAAAKREADPENKWDGNVPANYKTEDQKSLGRWVNRQRSAFAKNKLKQEWVKKLNLIGLKWSVHERKNANKNTGDKSLQMSKNEKETTIRTSISSNKPSSQKIGSVIATTGNSGDVAVGKLTT